MMTDINVSPGAEQVRQHQKMIQQILAENQTIFKNNLKSVNQLVGELTESPLNDQSDAHPASAQN